MRQLNIAAAGICFLSASTLAQEEPSCLSGKNPRFNQVPASSPSEAHTDVGMGKILEQAHDKFRERATDAIMSQVGTPDPAPNPAMKDQFGLAVNPSTLLPGYVGGFQQVVTTFNSEGAARALIDATMTDYAKRRILAIIVSRYQMVDQIVIQYRFRASQSALNQEEREKYSDEIGRLLNANDLYLKQFWGLDTLRPDVKDGTVRAKKELTIVDDDLKSERARKAARNLYKQIHDSDSSYKDLSLAELECRIQALARDAAEAERIQTARADAVKDRQQRDAYIQRTLVYDEKARREPSVRPGSTDIVPGGSGPPPVMWKSAGGESRPSPLRPIPEDKARYQDIAPKYTPLPKTVPGPALSKP